MPIENHENLIPIDSDAKIWRYMDIEKYKSLLLESGLFFCRADKFSDPFEGSLTRREYEHRWMGFGFGLHGEPVEPEKLDKDLEAISTLHRKLKRSTIVNCWHINTGESDAMWRLYLKDNEGVAIQSPAKTLFESLNGTPEIIHPSKIRYLNYDLDIWYHPEDYPHIHYNLIIPLIHKRTEFCHESEFRLFIDVPEAVENENYWVQPDGNESKGKMIHFNIEHAIERVIFPPTSNHLVDDRIRSLTLDFGYDFEFEKSKLNEAPYY